jgi:hypothetical protein
MSKTITITITGVPDDLFNDTWKRAAKYGRNDFGIEITPVESGTSTFDKVIAIDVEAFSSFLSTLTVIRISDILEQNNITIEP